MGLISDGQVHSSLTHLYALLKMAKEHGLDRVFVHCFLDGRDTPPSSAVNYVAALQRKIDEIGCGEIATVVGRYYAMDRDKRWERTQRAYDLLTKGNRRTSNRSDCSDPSSRTNEALRMSLWSRSRSCAKTAVLLRRSKTTIR